MTPGIKDMMKARGMHIFDLIVNKRQNEVQIILPAKIHHLVEDYSSSLTPIELKITFHLKMSHWDLKLTKERIKDFREEEADAPEGHLLQYYINLRACQNRKVVRQENHFSVAESEPTAVDRLIRNYL